MRAYLLSALPARRTTTKPGFFRDLYQGLEDECRPARPRLSFATRILRCTVALELHVLVLAAIPFHDARLRNQAEPNKALATFRIETCQPPLLQRTVRRGRRGRGPSQSPRCRVASRPAEVPTLPRWRHHGSARKQTFQNSSPFSRWNGKLIKVNDSATILKTGPSLRCPGLEVTLRRRRLR
ncbi:hypothetical protein HPB51_008466 [Rhipicephalus microplus]|uniref:Uncharacterized protein n=1 Tax=Rhipicephalus microplus TaxID=6941 RepID=A0A9J6ERL7_RHIMP|nr:hypothetical protein HPB51_008466 [Rhipicephalus microplus]